MPSRAGACLPINARFAGIDQDALARGGMPHLGKLLDFGQ